MRVLFYLALLVTAPSGWIAAQSAADRRHSAALELFEKKIRPALIEHCYECHSSESDSPDGDLRVDSGPGLRRGGQTGPALVPGEPQHSLLLSAIE